MAIVILSAVMAVAVSLSTVWHLGRRSAIVEIEEILDDHRRAILEKWREIEKMEAAREKRERKARLVERLLERNGRA